MVGKTPLQGDIIKINLDPKSQCENKQLYFRYQRVLP